MEQQACPLCQIQATFEVFDFRKRKRFLCDQCGRFIITTGAEQRLAESSKQWRDQLRAMIAKAPDDMVLEIRLSPVHSRQEGVAHQVFGTEYIPL